MTGAKFNDNRKKWEQVRDEAAAEHASAWQGGNEYQRFVFGFEAGANWARTFERERAEKLVGALVTINCGLVTTLDTAKYAGLRPKDIASLVLEEWQKEIE